MLTELRLAFQTLSYHVIQVYLIKFQASVLLLYIISSGTKFQYGIYNNNKYDNNKFIIVSVFSNTDEGEGIQKSTVKCA